MIKIIDGKQEGKFLSRRDYYRGKGLLAKIVMPITKRLRAYHAGKYIEPKESHLDIGCGDGYFMKRSKCRYIYGLDLKYGDFFKDKLDFPDNYFDYVTMLAVIEHLGAPEKVFKEVHRILKPQGKFIFSTPKKRANFFIKIYAENIEKLHCVYYSYEAVKKYSMNLFRVVDKRIYLFGLNQVFCLEKY